MNTDLYKILNTCLEKGNITEDEFRNLTSAAGSSDQVQVKLDKHKKSMMNAYHLLLGSAAIFVLMALLYWKDDSVALIAAVVSLAASGITIYHQARKAIETLETERLER